MDLFCVGVLDSQKGRNADLSDRGQHLSQRSDETGAVFSLSPNVRMPPQILNPARVALTAHGHGKRFPRRERRPCEGVSYTSG